MHFFFVTPKSTYQVAFYAPSLPMAGVEQHRGYLPLFEVDTPAEGIAWVSHLNGGPVPNHKLETVNDAPTFDRPDLVSMSVATNRPIPANDVRLRAQRLVDLGQSDAGSDILDDCLGYLQTVAYKMTCIEVVSHVWPDLLFTDKKTLSRDLATFKADIPKFYESLDHGYRVDLIVYALRNKAK